MERKLKYISLFSSAGVGCYGFKQKNFICIATVELLEKRLQIQKYNKICIDNSGYISGDISLDVTKEKIRAEIKKYDGVDVVLATPPCQGMSIANHKKVNELKRNSLVTESISLIKEFQPKFFVFENVYSFLKTICTSLDGKNKPIKDAITENLSNEYNILFNRINFKSYGCPSSRPRTIVIGVRRDLKHITPSDIFPDKQKEKTIKDIIGHLPSLNDMGEISKNDIYHSFKPYKQDVRNWIKDLKQGESAFSNKEPDKIPHTIVNGERIYNQNKNADKYKRQYWDKPAPCIHTRTDNLASQNTVHPEDDRAFSIREIMLLMSIPDSFKWSDIPLRELNNMPLEEKRKFLKKNEMNIRHCIGEAVPTIIFNQIATKISGYLLYGAITSIFFY